MVDFQCVRQFIGIGALLVALAGCGTSMPSRYYTLSSLADGAAAENIPCISLKVGPVELPKYLARKQIVSRPTANTFELAEFDKWAEPLEDNFLRVLTENLYSLLCIERVAMFPRASLMPVDYQLMVDVIRFDGNTDGNVTLTARWAVFGKSAGKVLATQMSTFVAPSGASGYESMVAAESRVLLQLSQEIARKIREVSMSK